MKNTKILGYIIFILFVIITGILYLKYYLNFHNFNLDNNKIKEKELIKNINSFSLDLIKDINGIELKYTPNLDLLDDIVYNIDSAKKRVYLEVYILTEKKIQKALKRAYNRGLDVKVLLEKNVYKAPYLNVKSYKNLKRYGINVKWGDSSDYTLNHTKILFIDNTVILSTGNYSYSTFKYNREFFMFIKDENIFHSLLRIFNYDFVGDKKNIDFPELILSPFSTRLKFNKLIDGATKNIKIYSQNFSDDIILDKLLQSTKKGISVDIIFPSIKKISSNIKTINILKKGGVNTYVVNKPYIHAKSIIIDNKYLYLGSINFSDYSIDKNREIGIIIKNENIIQNIVNLFNKDKLLINN